MLVIGYFFSAFFFFLAICLFLFLFFTRKNNKVNLEKNVVDNPNVAILIPARNESRVIAGLLENIKNQSFPVKMKNVFVIVESMSDPSFDICKNYGASVIVRKHLELKSKGYALQEAVEELAKSRKFYDAYFIMDADNVLDKNYLKEMMKDYKSGYGISTGYRSIKNTNNVIAVSAGLIYVFINEVLNKSNMRNKKSLLLSGTGFYIHGDYIRKWGTYPFHSLTEDVELSYYATLEGISMHYNDKAIFYDEQPTNFKQTVIQRKRWIKGYFVNWIKNFKRFPNLIKEKRDNKASIYSVVIGILPVLFLVISLIILLFTWIFVSISNAILYDIFPWKMVLICLFLLLWIYLALVLVTFLMLHGERNKIKVDSKIAFKVLWYHPIFLVSYVYVAILALFDKKSGWEVINHGNK